MKRGFLLLLLPCLLCACGSRPGNQPDRADTVQVELETVRVRQYVRDQLSFEFAAPRVVLEAQGAVVRVEQGVSGKIENLYPEEQKQ